MAGGDQEQALSAGSSLPLLTQGTMTEKRAFFGERSTRASVSRPSLTPSSCVVGSGGGLKSSER
jgi:hypothetical protein